MRPGCRRIFEPIEKFAPCGCSGHSRGDDPSAVDPLQKIPLPPAIPKIQPESHGVSQGFEYPMGMEAKRTDGNPDRKRRSHEESVREAGSLRRVGNTPVPTEADYQSAARCQPALQRL